MGEGHNVSAYVSICTTNTSVPSVCVLEYRPYWKFGQDPNSRAVLVLDLMIFVIFLKWQSNMPEGDQRSPPQLTCMSKKQKALAVLSKPKIKPTACCGGRRRTAR